MPNMDGMGPAGCGSGKMNCGKSNSCGSRCAPKKSCSRNSCAPKGRAAGRMCSKNSCGSGKMNCGNGKGQCKTQCTAPITVAE